MLPHEDDDDVVEVIDSKDESPKRPDADDEEVPRDDEIFVPPIYELNDEQNVKEVKVLLSKNRVAQSLITMDAPLLCSELDIVNTVFGDLTVLKDNNGYKILGGDFDQRAEVFAKNNPKCSYQYQIDVQDLAKSSDDCQIVVSDDDDSPQQTTPPNHSPTKPVDLDETHFEEVSLEGKALDQQEDQKFLSCLDAKNDIYVSENQKISCLKTENDSRDIKDNIKTSCSDPEGEINLSQNEKNCEDLFAILSQDKPVEEKPAVQDDDYNDDKEEMVAGAENSKNSIEINTSRFYSKGERELQSSSSQSRKTVQLSDSPGLSQRKSSRETSSSPRNSILAIYPLPPARGGITIYKENYKCLGDGEFLNDVIIDFYLKYLMNEVLSEKDRNRTHVFSSQFFTRLSKPDAAGNDEEVVMTEPERRHLGVQRWTKNINIFEKEFVIVPINEHLHWNLAIICFPGLVGELDDDTETLYRPCILFFDSLSNKNKDRIATILRGYLRQEYLAKTGENKSFANPALKVRYPRIPKQPNATDCGLYVLQYVEQFFKSPIEDYTVVPLNLSEWFHKSVIKRKRAEIATLVAELARKYRPEKDIVMPELQFPSDRVSSDEEDLDSRWTRRKNPYHKDALSNNGTAKGLSRVADTCASAVSKMKKSVHSDVDELMDGVRDAPSESDEHNLSLDMITFKSSDQSDFMDMTEDDDLIDDHNTANSKRDNSSNRALDCHGEYSFNANSSKYKYSNRHKISIIKEDFSGTKSHIFNKSSIFSNGEQSSNGVRPKRECRTKSQSEQMTELRNKFQARKRKNELKEGMNSEESKSKSFKWIDTTVFEPDDEYSFYNVDNEPGIHPSSTSYRDYKIHNKRLQEL